MVNDMGVFEKLKSGEAVDMMSEEYAPAIEELNRADKALFPGRSLYRGEVDGDSASITFTSVLNANAYGARGTFRMKGAHHYERRDGEWITVNR